MPVQILNQGRKWANLSAGSLFSMFESAIRRSACPQCFFFWANELYHLSQDQLGNIQWSTERKIAIKASGRPFETMQVEIVLAWKRGVKTDNTQFGTRQILNRFHSRDSR